MPPTGSRSGGLVHVVDTVYVMQCTAGSIRTWGVEVDWRDIKKLCPPSATLPTFLGSLVHFIKEIGKEHEEHLASCSHPNAFICEAILHKRMWDALQDMHPKTLACTFILTGNGKNLE
jgi:hypothetical protein